MNKNIKRKSLFSGWYQLTLEEAIEVAKWHIRSITTCKTNEEKLKLVNNRFSGIQFTVNDLL